MSSKKIILKSHHNCVYKINYYLVLVTKYRRKCFTKNILSRLEEICTNLCEKWEIGLIEFGGEADHIHLLLDFHPSIQPSKFINNLKTVTSRLVRRDYTEHLATYYWKPVLWTRAYCLLSVGGAPLSVVQKYIENQEAPKR